MPQVRRHAFARACLGAVSLGLSASALAALVACGSSGGSAPVGEADGSVPNAALDSGGTSQDTIATATSDGADASAAEAAGPDAGVSPQDSGVETAAPAHDAATDGAGSCLGTVTFRLLEPTGGARYCENMPCEFSSPITVEASGGQALAISRENNGCFVVDCAPCSGGGCSGACPQPTPLPDGGAEVSWDGTIWTPGATCGSGLACSTRGCAPPGQYTAHMCAYGLRGDAGCFGSTPATTPVCVDVPFAYPAQGPVVGTLP